MKNLIKKIFFLVLTLFFLPLVNFDARAAAKNGFGYEIFDMHEHFNVGGKMAVYLQAARQLGITKTLFVPTASAPDYKGYRASTNMLLKEQKKYPDRIIAFCLVNDEDPAAPRIFEKCLNEGGKGLKLYSGHPEFYDAPINSEIMKQLFSLAQERDVPVLIHLSIYRIPKAMEEFESLMDEFPNVRVQVAHFCSTVYNGIHLELCKELLDKYPNLYTDTSMGRGMSGFLEYVNENPEVFKEFILKYQDRILFGSDMILGGRGVTTNRNLIKKRLSCDLKVLTDAKQHCSLFDELLPVSKGLELPQEILKKIFNENPKKFLKIE